MRFLGMVVVSAFALLGGSVNASAPDRVTVPRGGGLEGANLLLVTVDTLRADALGAYGSDRGLTPRLDRLAAEGVRFERSYAHATMTLPSHASLLTGEYPFVHGVRDNGNFRLDDSRVTLAEILRDAGYANAAFVGAFVLDVRYGLAQGFDLYDDYYGEQEDADAFQFAQRRAEEVLTPAADWIDQQGGPWFSWVHLYDPHAPYEAPEPFARGVAAEPYWGEVAYVDHAIGRFLDRLTGSGALDNTLVVFTADHGESLGEHGEQTHGAFAYNATLRVPLMMWHASALEPAVVSRPAAHIDVVPTALGALGLRVPGSLPGIDLLAAEDDRGDRPIYFEAVNGYFALGLAPLTGVLDDRYKYIDLPRRELFDLAGDAGEEDNLADVDPDTLARYRESLETLLGAPATGRELSPALPGLVADAPMSLDAETRRRLEALGYVAGTGAPVAVGFTEADDPKNVIHLIEKQRSAWTDYGAGRPDAAIQSLREVLGERPQFLVGQEALASMLYGTGRLGEAIAVLETARELAPESASIAGKLGFYLALSGDTERASGLFNDALARAPENVELIEQSAIVASSVGNQAAARELLGRAARLDPSSASVEHNIGMTFLREQRYVTAIDHFRRSIALAPDFWNPYEGLGGALFAGGQKREAVDAWERAVALNPRAYDAIYNLAVVLAELGRRGDALGYIDRYVAEAPGDPQGKARLRTIAATLRDST